MKAKIFTHAPYLPVQPLGENNAEAFPSGALHKAGPCNRIENRHSPGHALDKLLVYGLVHGHQIFFFMAVSCPHDFVHQIPLIGKQQKSLRLLIQPPHRINPKRIIQIICHRGLPALLPRTAYNAPWLIKKQEHLLPFFCHRTSVHTDRRIRQDFIPRLKNPACAAHSPLLQKPVRLSPGAHACLAQIFIDSDFFQA